LMDRDDFGDAFPNQGDAFLTEDNGQVIRITPADVAAVPPVHHPLETPLALLPGGPPGKGLLRPMRPEEEARYRYGVTIEPPKRREQIFLGVVRNLRRRQEHEEYVVIFSNQLRQRTIEVLSFEVEVVDGNGNTTAHVPVEVRGHQISGDTLNDATPVAVYGERSRDGTVYTGRVLNLRTAAALSVMVVPRERCFVATAVYGSCDANEVVILRQFRDRCLRPHILGRALIIGYYHCGPWAADYVLAHPTLSLKVKKILDSVTKIASWLTWHFAAGSSDVHS
jgi:hypothetical protein